MFFRIILCALFPCFLQISHVRSQNAKENRFNRNTLKQDPVPPFRITPPSLLPDKPDFRINTDNRLPLVPSGSDLLKEYPESYNFDGMRLPSPTVKTGISYKQFILPAALIGYGTFETVMAANNVHLGNYAVHNQVQKHVKSRTKIDNYTQYAPAASVYALNLIGIQGKNNFRDRTIVLGLASAFTAISVNGLKYTTKVERPSRSRKNSFPSGHTAVAFMGAEFLWQEYKDVSVWYGIAGYTVAAGTGALRMYNNKHWLGDVAAGAGFGILSTKLAYLIQPKISRMFTGGNKNRTYFVVAPSYNGEHAELMFSVRL